MSILAHVPSGSANPPGGDGLEYEELVDWLIAKVAGYLNVPPDTLGIDTPFADHGVDSVTGLQLCADLKCEKGFTVDTTIVWDHPTIGDIATYLIEEQPS